MKKAKWQNLIIIFLPVFGFAFIIMSAYPGFMSLDSLDQYSQAKSGLFTDWHPPLMAWIWSKLLFIKDGPQPILILNNLLYWSAAFIIARKIKKFGLSLLFLILCFAPPLINFIGVIWKDTFLLSLLFFQSSVLFYFFDQHLNLFKKIVLILLLCGLSLVCVMLRHNAASAIMPLIVLPVYYFFKKINLSVTLFIGLLVTTGLFFSGLKINKKLCNGKSLHPEQQLMVYDLMGLSDGLKKNIFPHYLKGKITLDTLPSIYSPCDGAMFAIFNMGCATKIESQFDSLKNIWKKEVFSHPEIMIRHKYRSFKCLLMESSLTTFPYIQPNDFGFAVNEKNPARTIFVQYTESKCAIPFYKAWIYLLACTVIFFTIFISYLRKRNSNFILSLFISLSGLLYSLTYFPLSPCNDLRYNYWTIGASFLSFIFFLDALNSKKTLTR